MSELCPRSPLSISSESNGSSDNVQDNVSCFDPNAQTANPVMLDGVRSHYAPQSGEPSRPTYTDALKYGEVMVVVSTQYLNQNLVFNLALMNIQGSF